MFPNPSPSDQNIVTAGDRGFCCQLRPGRETTSKAELSVPGAFYSSSASGSSVRGVTQLALHMTVTRAATEKV
ncbi:hypothetical protein JZ751_020601 [Albula glossodonta]|uniref:Uncharacterized protein n=1 Tax=Albula glossodonta TaxID=121402 RepID=A0A8T2PNB5_9TELE|nr:hypothetical protein JZ751_020601 [Albula glossodonta]